MARILVIDDNRDNLDLMQYLLRAFGHEALIASGGESGVALARLERPALVVCDVHMPGADGYAVLQALRGDALLRETPVLAVTALNMRGDRERCLAAGFDGYLAKPIDPQTFVAHVETFLHRGAEVFAFGGDGGADGDDPGR